MPWNRLLPLSYTSRWPDGARLELSRNPQAWMSCLVSVPTTRLSDQPHRLTASKTSKTEPSSSHRGRSGQAKQCSPSWRSGIDIEEPCQTKTQAVWPWGSPGEGCQGTNETGLYDFPYLIWKLEFRQSVSHCWRVVGNMYNRGNTATKVACWRGKLDIRIVKKIRHALIKWGLEK